MKTLAIWLGSLILVAVVLAAIAGLGYFKYRQMQAAMQAPPPPEQATSVRIAEATEVEYQQQATMIGTVLAPRSVALSNEIAGTVVRANLQPGQTVEAGEVLVELDTSVERAQLQSAIARRTIANSTLSRIREAAATGAVTPSELEQADAQFAQADAEVAELNAVIERKTLRAPFRARIGLSDTHEGQFLPSGSQITTLQSVNDFVYVDFMIPQIASNSVEVGLPVNMSFRDQILNGEIIALDAQADRQSRNVLARAQVPAAPSSLRPGDSLKVIVPYGPRRRTPAVPVESLLTAPMQNFVFVVSLNEEGQLRAHEQPVVPGPTIDGRLSIVSGLEVGQMVVADGAFKLRDGALVSAAASMQPDATAPANPPQASVDAVGSPAQASANPVDTPGSLAQESQLRVLPKINYRIEDQP